MFNTYIHIQWRVSQTEQNFIMLIIVLGRHVSIPKESSSGPSKKIDPYLKCLKMRCGIPNVYILDKLCIKCMCRFAKRHMHFIHRFIKRLGSNSAFLNILSKVLFFLEGPEDESLRLETCCPSTIINTIKFSCVWLTHHCIFITLPQFSKHDRCNKY